MSPTAQLRPVMTTQGNRYAVAAIVVQEGTEGAGTTGRPMPAATLYRFGASAEPWKVCLMPCESAGENWAYSGQTSST